MSKLFQWLDARLPISKTYKAHLSEYHVPKNLNIWYIFGVLLLIVLVSQIVSGIFLAMFYKPDAKTAFDSVEYIMRDVEWGWLIRYIHSTGASLFFILIYLHMMRGLLYGSYRSPREMVWIIGMLMYLLLMAEAFMGYVLPWGQMSFWGAKVIISLFGSVPVIGPDIQTWVLGDFDVADATLNRFFALHVVALPMLLLVLVYLHIIALHEVGSGNPDGIEIKSKKDASGKPLDSIPFHPFYTTKDLVAIIIFFIIFAIIVFYAPEMGGYFLEHNNFQVADPLNAPAHVAPVWYFTTFYSILRAVTYPLFGIDANFWGMIAMFSAVLLFFLLPWLDRGIVKSIRYRGMLYKTFLFLFVLAFITLGYLGTQAVTSLTTAIAQIMSVIYFAFFLLMPIYTKLDKTKTPPDRIK